MIDIRVVYDRPRAELPDGEPAQIDADDERVTVTHARFDAVIDPFARRATIYCLEPDHTFAYDLTHRAAMSAILPLDGGMLLHSAGIVIDGRAIAFFGPSGAGKSTLSSLVDQPVLSDELIAIRREGDAFVAAATGIWGELGARPPVEGSFALTHLVALDRGDGVSIEPMTAREAFRALVGVATVPPNPKLWHKTMEVVHELARLPVSRLKWNPSRDNAGKAVEALRR
jgi:hypothetical protein